MRLNCVPSGTDLATQRTPPTAFRADIIRKRTKRKKLKKRKNNTEVTTNNGENATPCDRTNRLRCQTANTNKAGCSLRYFCCIFTVTVSVAVAATTHRQHLWHSMITKVPTNAMAATTTAITFAILAGQKANRRKTNRNDQKRKDSNKQMDGRTNIRHSEGERNSRVAQETSKRPDEFAISAEHSLSIR